MYRKFMKCRYLFLLLIILFITGCSKFDANMEIKDDKSMEFSILYTYDKTVYNSDPTNLINEENKNKLTSAGFTIENYEVDNNVGIKISKKIDNIDDVSEENKFITYDLFDLPNFNNDTKLFKVRKGFIRDTYTASFKVSNKDNVFNIDQSNYNSNNKVWGSSENFKFSLKLPHTAGSNNANKSGDMRKNLVWNLSSYTSIQSIEFEFYFYNMKNIYIVIGAVILFIVFVILSNMGKNNPTDDINNVKVAVDKKETYQTPINVPSTPVTTGEIGDIDSFNFLKDKSSSSAKEEEEIINSTPSSPDDVNFIMSQQMHHNEDNNESEVSTGKNNNVPSIEDFMNSAPNLEQAQNEPQQPQNINNQVVNSVQYTPQGGIPEIPPELMSSINNDNNNS